MGVQQLFLCFFLGAGLFFFLGAGLLLEHLALPLRQLCLSANLQQHAKAPV